MFCFDLPLTATALAVGLESGVADLEEGFELGAAADEPRNQERMPDIAVAAGMPGQTLSRGG